MGCSDKAVLLLLVLRPGDFAGAQADLLQLGLLTSKKRSRSSSSRFRSPPVDDGVDDDPEAVGRRRLVRLFEPQDVEDEDEPIGRGRCVGVGRFNGVSDVR